MVVINDNDFPLLPTQDGKRHPQRRAHVNTVNTRSKGGLGASLNDLPDELILEILQYLRIRNSKKPKLHTLLNLSLTNRRFYRIVIKQIYERFESYFSEPHKFLRTMILKPGLADLVHEVDISFSAYLGRRSDPTAQDKKIVKEGLRVLATPGWKDWAADCNNNYNYDEAVYKAILFYTRNVKSLRFHGQIHVPSRSVDWFSVFETTTVGILSDRAHGFQHLRSVSIENNAANLIQLAPLFRLQSLQTLEIQDIDCWAVNEGHALSLQRLIPRACNNLERLILGESFHPKSILSILLASSRKLKYFKYDTTIVDYAEVRDETSISLSRALAYQKNSLEDIDVYSSYQKESQVDVHLRDGLENFSALKWITCPLSKLASGGSDTFVERLPPSLLKLRIYVRQYTDDLDCVEALEHMIANYQSHTPQLQEITVAASPSAWETYDLKKKYDWSRLVQLSSTTGLSFTVERQRKWRSSR